MPPKAKIEVIVLPGKKMKILFMHCQKTRSSNVEPAVKEYFQFNNIFFEKLIEMKTKLGHIFARVVRDSTFSCWPEVYVQGQL